MKYLKTLKWWLVALCLVAGILALPVVHLLQPSQAQPSSQTSPTATVQSLPPRPLQNPQLASPLQTLETTQHTPTPQPLLAPLTFPTPEVRGIWIHTYAPFNWDAAMQKIADAHFNCVFVRAARGINAIYPSKFLAQDAWATAASGDELRRAVDAAYRHGLKFHAWVVCFNAGGTSTAQGANVRAFGERMAREDRVVRDIDGKQGPHLNPADPRNQQLVVNVCREIVQNYAVDGIQLDYIRYPDAPTYDYDYGAVPRRRFEASVGHRVANWPSEVFSGSLKRQYEDWERDQITGIVRAVRKVTQSAATSAARPRVSLSAALWRMWRHNRATIKQDWVNWVRAGLLDFAVPMNYKTDDALVRQSLREEVAQVGGQVPLVAGIGNWQLSPTQLVRQIAIARQEGASGYCLFAYNAANLDAQLAALRSGPQRVASPFDVTPRLHWQIKGGITRPDDAPVFVVGQQVEADCSFWRGEDAGIPYVIFHSATLQNVTSGKTRSVSGGEGEELMTYWRFTVPYGRWRMVAQGVVHENRGTRPCVVYGPIVEGVTPLFAQRLAARDLPPIVPRRAGRRVAVFNDGVGAPGILAALQNVPNVNAFALNRLWPTHLAKAQVVIVPQPNDALLFTPDVEATLRAWVKRGGHLILTHDAVGFRWDVRLFPAIGEGIALSKKPQLRVEPGFGLTPGMLTHAYADHVVLKPNAAQVLVREWKADGSDGEPVIIRGHWGRGTVTMMGTLAGYAPLGGAMPAPEKQLLLELLKTL